MTMGVCVVVMTHITALGQPAPASRPATATTAAALAPQLDDAVARGLEYLARHQADDGSIGDETDRVVSTSPTASSTTAPATAPATGPTTAPSTVPTTAPSTAPAHRRHLAMTATSLLAFLSSGNAPDVGRHGFAASSAVDFLLDHVPDDGYAGAMKGGKGDDSGMAGQGVVAVALAEAYGVEQSDQVRTRLRRTLARMLPVILAAQLPESTAAHAGGWGVVRDAKESDPAATVWNVLALCACRAVGYDIPEPAFRAATGYFTRRRNDADGGFSFQPASPGEAGATAAAVVCLSAMRVTPEAKLGEAKRVLAALRGRPTPATPLFSTYLACQAVAEDDALRHGVAFPTIGALIKSQTPDGGWVAAAAVAPPDEPGRVYATAMAVLTLSTTYNLLPLYAR
jgi:hypothetical protein